MKKEERYPSLIGMKFNRITVIHLHGSNKKGQREWECLCECGGHIIATTNKLKNNRTKSCGCINKNKEYGDITGKRFNRLTVSSFNGLKNNRKYYNCLCDCGKLTVVRNDCIVSGQIKSCGCLMIENTRGLNLKHGSCSTRLYRTWMGMKNRIRNKNLREYKRYGGRGITICDEWLDFEAFYNWAKISGYKDNLTIERINNNGNYCPSNCTWVTRGDQSYNKSTTRYIEFKGSRLPLSLMAEKYNLSTDRVFKRLMRGWDIEKTLLTPVRIYNKH